MAKIVDDVFDKLESDISKIRTRHRQYISYSNEQGAKSVANEILDNALDECKNPRSPANMILVEFDERDGFLQVSDNGRGIPSNILEEVYTTLNMGSNINTSRKADLKAEILGQNGTGTLAICGLAERVEITSFRGPTEGIWKLLVFEEGAKVSEETGKCDPKKHGMTVRYKPSKVMGKNTRIIWNDIKNELLNLQYLNKKKINIQSKYIDIDGNVFNDKYNITPFEEILYRNDKKTLTSSIISLTIDADSVIEELDGESVKRFISMDLAFVYTSDLNPYIDSFSNSNNTVDGGDHIDGANEALCRYFQNVTKNSMSDKEKSSLDIKWDDVKHGLSMAVALRTNYERLYTGQTKHKVVNSDIKRIIIQLVMDELNKFFEKNPTKLRELIGIVKMNAKARREGEKIRTAVVKTVLTNWSSYKMANYDPCTNKGLKEYKELFIIEGDSARGTLKTARNPVFQALFAIRGVSKNSFRTDIDQLIGPNGNKEFTDLVTVMGCNVGLKFDINKLIFNKIILASDADIDGYFIRSLLLAFFFKVFPEIIMDGRVYISEPPLYKINDPKNPFVVNNEEYNARYVREVVKYYKIGQEINGDIMYFDKKKLTEFLSDSIEYVDENTTLSNHYRTNGRLLEMIAEEIAMICIKYSIDLNANNVRSAIDKIDIQKFMDKITITFRELYYNDSDHVIEGAIDGTPQQIEISDQLVRKLIPSIKRMIEYDGFRQFILKDIKTGIYKSLSMLECLKVLKKFQPEKLHRFKGLGENKDEDIKTTIMDPNTRSLIRVNIHDIENDMKIFQLLRGNSSIDRLGRKQMMNEYKIPRSMIDT